MRWTNKRSSAHGLAAAQSEHMGGGVLTMAGGKGFAGIISRFLRVPFRDSIGTILGNAHVSCSAPKPPVPRDHFGCMRARPGGLPSKLLLSPFITPSV